VREQVEVGTIILKKIDTKVNLADVFTNALDRNQFQSIISNIMCYTPYGEYSCTSQVVLFLHIVI